MEKTIALTVNGSPVTVTTEEDRSLLEILREDLGLTGTKYGCGEGQCGACTVLVDGRATRSCLLSAGRANGVKVTTIEGLEGADGLHPVQEAFLAEGAMQCGYCVPGMILRAVDLLNRDPQPTDAKVRTAMNGNLCRCNGYVKILAAIRRAAGQPAAEVSS